jgi:anti-anti-sigma factor
VSYVDSAGLGALVQAHLTFGSRGGRLVLVYVPTHTNRLIEMTRLGSTFDRYESDADAVAAFSPR